MDRWRLAGIVFVAAGSLGGLALAQQTPMRQMALVTPRGWRSYAPLAPASGPRGVVASGVSAPPSRVAARRLLPSAPNGLPFGTVLPQNDLGIRVFFDRSHGFALATRLAGGVQTYPVASSDSGQTWRIAGPILHIDAAQGAIAVSAPGVAGARFYYAWDDGYNNIVDATTDAGRRWWQTSLPGAVLSVTTEAGTVRALIALVEGPTTDPARHGASLWSYRTTDGRHWQYLSSLNAVS
jgi:hypothetical protein